jgi:hypothetical protein
MAFSRHPYELHPNMPFFLLATLFGHNLFFSLCLSLTILGYKRYKNVGHNLNAAKNIGIGLFLITKLVLYPRALFIRWLITINKEALF